MTRNLERDDGLGAKTDPGRDLVQLDGPMDTNTLVQTFDELDLAFATNHPQVSN